MLLKGGHLVDPSTGRDEVCDLRIVQGRVNEIGTELSAYAGEEVLDLTGRYVFPGFVDLHVHFRDPGLTYKETLKTGSEAAAAGGYTAVCPMPNTMPSTDSAEKIAELLRRAKEECKIHILPISAVTVGQEGTEPVDLASVRAAGAKGISEDGKSVMNVTLYREALKEAAKQELLMLAHCEDKNLVANGVINEGQKSEEFGLPGIPNSVEDIITARDIFLAGETGARLHLCHCSTKGSVELLAMGQRMGYQVTGEVCPHHFVLCDEDIVENDGNFKMNPPLRKREDVEALIAALKSGVLTCISTDHAPHSEEEKAGGFLGTPFGIVGSETAFALGYTYLVRTGELTLSQLIACMSTNPARIIGHDGGTLEVGAMADLTIAELNTEYLIDKDKFLSKGKNTPFHGYRVYGKTLRTMVGGETVYCHE